MGRTLPASLICATLTALLCAHAPGQDPPGPPREPDPKRPTLDKLKLPPGTVVILTDDVAQALKQVPRGVFLTPEKYQELVDRLAQMEKLLKPERRTPSSCRLRATVEGRLVHVQAEFAFTTEQPRTVVTLGCRGAHLTDARIRRADAEGEGAVPLLELGPDGYAVTAEKPGEYFVTLGMKLPLSLAARGGERSFDLALPGAAVTTLTLDLPHAVKELRWNKTTEKARPAGKPQKRWEDLPLGKLTSLSVSWHDPPPANDAGPLLTATGQVVVRVEEHQAVVTAELTLTDLRARTTTWRLWLPPQASVAVSPPDGLTGDVREEGGDVHVVRVSEPTGDPVRVTVTTRQARPFKTPLPVGPYAVLGAFRQEGTVEVRASTPARRGARPQYQLQGAIEERDPPREIAGGDLLAYFRWWNMPAPGKSPPPKGVKGPTSPAPLLIDLKPPTGRVETSVEHYLRVRPLGQPGQGAVVDVTTRILAKPLGDAVDFLDIQLPRARPEALAVLAAPWPLYPPAGWPLAGIAMTAQAPAESEWLVGGAEVTYPSEAARKQRRARVRLAAGPKGALVELTGSYLIPAGARAARLDMPRPLAIKEGRGKVRLEAQGGLELALEEFGIDAVGRLQHAQDTDAAPAQVDLAWRPYRPELPATAEADVTLHDRDATVRAQFAFKFPERATGGRPYEVRLRVPAAAQALAVSAPWEVVARDQRLGFILVAPRGGGPPREPLVVTYRFDLPPEERGEGGAAEAVAEPREFEVPLLWPEQATRAATKVRLWGLPGTLPALAEGHADDAWKDRGTEVVPGKGLPTRVLVGDGVGMPLWLRIDPAPPLLAGVVIDRALVQVKVDEEGSEEYRVRYLLSQLHARHLDLKLPAAAAGQSLQVRLAGEAASWGFRGDGGRLVRVPVAAGMPSGPVVLEVTYQLPRNQPEGEGLWQTALHAPEVQGNVFLGRVRWQVSLPPAWLPVPLGSDVHAEVEWGWRGWLPGPVAAETSARLEEWLTGQAAAEDVVPSLVCSRSTLEPLRLFRPPLQAWFLICSGVLLLVALLMYALPAPPGVVWLVLSGLAVGAAVAGLLWPTLLPLVAYGSLPGAAVLLVLAIFQWMLHRRYQRQVVFMPGFKRAKPGSSLVRGTGLRPREASTVDAPMAPGSAVSKGTLKNDT